VDAPVGRTVGRSASWVRQTAGFTKANIPASTACYHITASQDPATYCAQIPHCAGCAAQLCCQQTLCTYHSDSLEGPMPPQPVVFVLRGAPAQLVAGQQQQHDHVNCLRLLTPRCCPADASFCSGNSVFIFPAPFASLSAAHTSAAATGIHSSSSFDSREHSAAVSTSGRPHLLWQLAR
jgi:hypothetical protein